jgi:hypothetical protein
MTPKRGCICVFAKPPRAGLVKTRLVPELGEGGAAALARAFFQDTWTAVSGLDWADPILATTEVDAREWGFSPDIVVWRQARGDLGRRMEGILRRALATHPFALAVGTDTPGLPVALLDSAREALQTADAVLGPSEDGGFYLLGLRACPSGLLARIPWSTKDTFTQTLAQLRRRGLRTTVLPPWFDVDRPEDLDRLRMLLAAGRVIAPATARVLVDSSRAECEETPT